MPNSEEPNPKAIDPNALRSDANAVVDEAKSVASKVTEEASEQVHHLADEAKAQLGEATDKVKGVAGDQKDFLAGQLDEVAGAIGRVAADLEGSNASSAHYARVIADNADKLTASIRDKDVDQILADAQDFGRQQPAAFMGAAALLGFAASRILLASAKRQQDRAAPTAAPSPTSYASAPTPVDNGAPASTAYDAGRL